MDIVHVLDVHRGAIGDGVKTNPQVDDVLAQIGLAGGIQTSPFYRVLHEKPQPKLMLMLANGNTPIHTRLCTHALLCFGRWLPLPVARPSLGT